MSKVSPSAKGVAYLRHLEVDVSRDTLADYFYNEEGKKLAEYWLEKCPYMRRTVAIRGRYIEDMAAKYIGKDGIKQMLNIAAGLNTFPYRHKGASELEAYAEFDLPTMIEFKKDVIGRLIDEGVIPSPEFDMRHIGADLSSPCFSDDFRKMHWDWKRPSVYVLEGMSYYLPMDKLQEVVDTFADTMAKGSVLIMDYFPDYVRNNDGLTAVLDHLPSTGAETCVTYLSKDDVERLLKRFTIISDRLEDEMEPEYYPDRICKPIGSIVVAEMR